MLTFQNWCKWTTSAQAWLCKCVGPTLKCLINWTNHYVRKACNRLYPVASRNNIFGGCPLHWCDATEYIQQEINNDNSQKTEKSRLTFISAFSVMVTVTLMKTAVAKNLSQSIIICVKHQKFSKSIRQPCQYPIFGGMPGHPPASITRRHRVSIKEFA